MPSVQLGNGVTARSLYWPCSTEAIAYWIGSSASASQELDPEPVGWLLAIVPLKAIGEWAMSRSGAVTLNDLEEPDGPVHLTIVCGPCAREGRYLVRRLIAEHGDMGLPDVLALMTQDCPKHQTVAIHDRCNAVFKP